jgi:phosphatidylglycerol:prolipoprotein diacylglycerol transferase
MPVDSRRLGYALCMGLAAAVFILARRLLPAPPAVAHLPARHKWLLAWAAFVGGVFGAKAPFVPSDAWLGDGKTLTTGLIGGYLAVELMKLALGIRIKTGDSWAIPLALGLAIGRWGCYCNGCCFGTPSDLPWACDFGDGTPRHPTQIYESLFHLGMVIVLMALTLTHRCESHRLQLYLIAYGLYRFASEYIRPEPRGWLGLTFYQGAALILIVGPALQWMWEARRNRVGHFT